MNKPKITPGEWVFENPVTDTVGQEYLKTREGFVIIARIGAYEFDNISIEETNRNAQLIAAAPDLAEALNDMIEMMEVTGLAWVESKSEIYDKAKAALLKAGYTE